MKKQNIFLKFIIPIIAVIVLLAVQALCDLELPSYTSDIINNGIQQGGIDSGLPEVLTSEIYNGIAKISKEDLPIMVSYDLFIPENLNSQDLEALSEKYPLLKEENLYLLKDLTEEEKSIVEERIKIPLLITTMLYSNNEDIAQNLNLTIPEGSTLLDVVLQLDDETFNTVINSIEQSLKSMDSMMLDQYAISSVKAIYNEIGMDMDKYQISYIMNKGLIMLGIAGAGMVIAIIVGFLVAKLAAKIGYVLREKVVRKIMSFSSKEFKEFGASSLITRSTNDIEQIKMFFIMLLRIVVFAPIMGIGAFIKVSDNPLNWIIGIALIVIFVLIGILFGFAMPKFKSMQKLIDKMNLVSREIITGMPVIRTFGTEKHEEERFDKANIKLTKTNLFVNRLMGIMMPSMMLVMNIISILIVWYGAKQIDIGSLQVGTLLAFISYTMQIIMSFLMISLVSVMMPRALVSLKRIREILKKEVSIVEPENPVAFKEEAKGTIEFKDVSFKYPDADEAMLKNISFKATPGTTTAFIGSTGSGKSTLINLIPRFFDATNGEIYVDGINIKDASVMELRNRIGYVPQKGMLFSGTIKSNLMFGNDNLTEEDMIKVAKVSQSLEFIDAKKDKFESEISQGGTNVSGGQKQRLSIARAIAKNPEIYIFDDSFSALDFKTDAALRKALFKHAKDATILIVAQRISTIMNADNIIVLNEGEIVGSGSHKELLKTCKIYKEIALSQLKEEEL
ncbi:aBC-type transport system multidrug-family ATP-binding/permease [Mycoplasma sp. CAG:776]|nr:aBC-type transport system multidrug-family ATP-binding/permease [Mycoplasma sp. CAG:776]